MNLKQAKKTSEEAFFVFRLRIFLILLRFGKNLVCILG
jgi:hypothetical protein